MQRFTPTSPETRTFTTTEYEDASSGSHTRVHYKENKGYFQSLGDSLCGIVFGFLIVFLSFPLLFWNEGRAVDTAKSLDEGISIVTPLDSIIDPLESNDNKLVHLSGQLRTDIPLSDAEFGIRVQAVHLKRRIEMYQWVETKQKREFNEGGRTRVETTYSYHKEWKSNIISSSGFSDSAGHQNPSTFPISTYTKTAESVYIGAFRLSSGLKSAITNFNAVHPKKKVDGWTIVEQHLYRSVDPYHPRIGDIRLSFAYAGRSHQSKGQGLSRQPDVHDLSDSSDQSSEDSIGSADIVSVIARQNENNLSPYKTKSGGTLELLYQGSLSAQEIFEAEHTSNTYLTWGLRFVGWFLMFIGFQMIMDIFRALVSFIPLVRDVVGLATGLVALSFSLSLSLLVVAVGWFWYRPLLSVALVVVAVVPLAVSRQKANKKKETKE